MDNRIDPTQSNKSTLENKTEAIHSYVKNKLKAQMQKSKIDIEPLHTGYISYSEGALGPTRS